MSINVSRTDLETLGSPGHLEAPVHLAVQTLLGPQEDSNYLRRKEVESVRRQQEMMHIDYQY